MYRFIEYARLDLDYMNGLIYIPSKSYYRRLKILLKMVRALKLIKLVIKNEPMEICSTV